MSSLVLILCFFDIQCDVIRKCTHIIIIIKRSISIMSHHTYKCCHGSLTYKSHTLTKQQENNKTQPFICTFDYPKAILACVSESYDEEKENSHTNNNILLKIMPYFHFKGTNTHTK